jgi:hypothetical protein
MESGKYGREQTMSFFKELPSSNLFPRKTNLLGHNDTPPSGLNKAKSINSKQMFFEIKKDSLQHVQML